MRKQENLVHQGSNKTVRHAVRQTNAEFRQRKTAEPDSLGTLLDS